MSSSSIGDSHVLKKPLILFLHPAAVETFSQPDRRIVTFRAGTKVTVIDVRPSVYHGDMNVVGLRRKDGLVGYILVRLARLDVL